MSAARVAWPPRRFAVRLALATALLVLAWGAPASAHLMPAKQGTVNIVGDAAFVVLSIPVSALHGWDDDGDGVMTLAEMKAHQGALRDEIDPRLVVTDGDATAKTVRLDLVLSPDHEVTRAFADHIIALKHAQFDAPPRDLGVSTELFGRADADRQLTMTGTRKVGERTETEVAILTPLTPAHRFFRPLSAALRDYVRAGAEHVLLGTDHLLFLLTAIVAGLGIRYWLGVISAFTVAHSLTLGAALLGYVHVAPRIVEPAIAFSIVVMALRNLRRGSDTPGRRVALVGACGLLHGLGFASSMDAMGLDTSHRVGSLVGFNLGVELGQLVFLAGALGLLVLGHRLAPRIPPARVRDAVSIFAVVVGSVWMVQRVLPTV